MAGHNKWKQIKHKKAATDAKRSREFSKLARMIAVESKKVKGDDSAASLRAAIDIAKRANMPKDNIERAIQKGKADTGADLEAVRYETYGPGGVAVIIDGYTDSRNRTAAEIKHLLTKEGFALAAPGSAVWAFQETVGVLTATMTTTLSETDAQRLADLIEKLEEHDDVHQVHTNAE